MISSAAICPEAPGLFSTTTAWSSNFCNCSLTIRAKTSLADQGPKATTMRTGLADGQDCACAPLLTKRTANKVRPDVTMDETNMS